jgi:N-acetylneuraminic acid mutarotase
MSLKNVLLSVFSIFMCVSLHAASQWSQKASFGGIGRHRPTGISIGTKVYLGLGHYNGTGTETYLSDWWEFDPSSNSWTQKVDYPGNGGNGELGAHGMGLETVGYVGLGEIDDYGFYKYDPGTNTWTAMTEAPSGGSFQDTGDFTIGHRGYFTRISSDQVYEYDADLDVWTGKGFTPFNVTYSFSGFAIGGKGYMKVSNSACTVNTFWEYDPTSDIWVEKTPFPGLARLSSISFVQNDKGYIVSGYGAGLHSDLSSEVWQYDPLMDTWSQLGDFIGTKRRYSTGITLGNKCYLGTGTNGTNLNDFWEFDSAVAGQEDLFDASSFAVFPNPAVDFVKFQSEKTLVFDLVIYSLSGRQISRVHTNTGSVHFERNGLSSGTYFYSVEVDGQTIHSDRFTFR